jgi:hypothetical protein
LGSIDAYIKLPAGTLPEALFSVSSDGLHIYENDEWQLLIFSLEEYDEYFDDEHAGEFFQHLAGLRSGLMLGDWLARDDLFTFAYQKCLVIHNS